MQITPIKTATNYNYDNNPTTKMTTNDNAMATPRRTDAGSRASTTETRVDVAATPNYPNNYAGYEPIDVYAGRFGAYDSSARESAGSFGARQRPSLSTFTGVENGNDDAADSDEADGDDDRVDD